MGAHQRCANCLAGLKKVGCNAFITGLCEEYHQGKNWLDQTFFSLQLLLQSHLEILNLDMNFYPFHIGDYISHTSHLSDKENLAYRKMIDLYYQNEIPFVDEFSVARKIKSTPKIVLLLLKEFFVLENDGWHNKRADEEINKYKAKSDSARKANEIRWQSKSDLKSDLKSDAVQILTKNQEPVTSNQEPITTTTKTNTSPPDGVSERVFSDYLKLRKGLKAPVTETAIRGLEREANKAGLSLQNVMELCCQNGWRGFKADWIKEKKTVGEIKSITINGLTRGLLGGNNEKLLSN